MDFGKLFLWIFENYFLVAVHLEDHSYLAFVSTQELAAP